MNERGRNVLEHVSEIVRETQRAAFAGEHAQRPNGRRPVWGRDHRENALAGCDGDLDRGESREPSWSAGPDVAGLTPGERHQNQ